MCAYHLKKWNSGFFVLDCAGRKQLVEQPEGGQPQEIEASHTVKSLPPTCKILGHPWHCPASRRPASFLIEN